MPITPSDTSTTLNLGAGGDSIDESQVTQTVTGTKVKRARVAIGGDDGSLQDFVYSGKAKTSSSVSDTDTHKMLSLMYIEMRRTTQLLKILIVHSCAIDSPSDEELDAMDTHMDLGV